MSHGYQKFRDRFRFDPKKAGFVGVERESFLTEDGTTIVPIAPRILRGLPNQKRYGYELSACQLEDRTEPTTLESLRGELRMNNSEIHQVERSLGFRRLFQEVAPADMPTDLYPDPSGRYQKIAQNIPASVLLAACRIIGTHVHIGMPDHETALRVYNATIPYVPVLSWMGDGSHGERLRLYHEMIADPTPPVYANWPDFQDKARKNGFEDDPKRCWHLVRISVHGTIEFRMFGATDDINKIFSWAEYCHLLCEYFMH